MLHDTPPARAHVRRKMLPYTAGSPRVGGGREAANRRHRFQMSVHNPTPCLYCLLPKRSCSHPYPKMRARGEKRERASTPVERSRVTCRRRRGSPARRRAPSGARPSARAARAHLRREHRAARHAAAEGGRRRSRDRATAARRRVAGGRLASSAERAGDAAATARAEGTIELTAGGRFLAAAARRPPGSLLTASRRRAGGERTVGAGEKLKTLSRCATCCRACLRARGERREGGEARGEP